MAHMECDLRSDRPEDRAYLVLWYIETQKQPIYRYVLYRHKLLNIVNAAGTCLGLACNRSMLYYGQQDEYFMWSTGHPMIHFVGLNLNFDPELVHFSDFVNFAGHVFTKRFTSIDF